MAYTPNANNYVQNASGVWTPVGFAAGNASIPSVLRDSVTPANMAGVDSQNNLNVVASLASTATLGTALGNIGVPFYATGVTSVASTASIAAPGVGLSIYVTDMEGSNEGATGTAIAFSEGAATPVRYRRFLAASGGGFVTNLRTPWKLPANTALWALVSAATTWNYTINYYVAV